MVALRILAGALRARVALSLGLCLLLDACTSAPKRAQSEPIAAPDPAAPAPTASIIAAPPAPQPAVPQPAEPPPALVSPWDRLRARLAMPGCDYNPAVQRWAK